MKINIATYNINGIRSSLRKKIDDWLQIANIDILCLQEIKANPSQFDQNIFNNLGYSCFINSADKPGYSGVAILTKKKPLNVVLGCGIEKIDREGRVIRLDFSDFSVINAYFPSGSSGQIRQDFKMFFLEKFYEYIYNLQKEIPNLIISGDFNICHKEIDIHNPKANINSSGFLPEERNWMDQFFNLGFIDSFRFFNKSPHQYTWWSYRANARAKNLGWRIDYILVSNKFSQYVAKTSILNDVIHSDHCPVVLHLKD